MHETEYPHIVKKAGQPASLADWPRIRVSQIVADHLDHGWSAEEILRQHPDLRPGQVYAALTYFYDHFEVIVGELRQAAEQAAAGAEQQPLSRAELLARRAARGS
jgi:uncharacterized protein (DUF433 family)